MFRSTRLAGLFLLVGSCLAVFGLFRLDYQDNPRDLYLRAGPDSELLEHMYRSFGSDDNVVMILAECDGPLFAMEPMTDLHRVTTALREMPAIETVNSLFDLRRQRVPIPIIDMDDATPERLQDAEAQIQTHPLARGLMVSADGEATVVTARLAGQSLSIDEMASTLIEIERLLEPLRENSPLTFHIAGPPVVRVESLARLRVDQIRFSALGGVAALLLALLIFRQWQSICVALFGPALGVLWALGAMGWFGQRIDGIKIIIPTLLFVIGFTDSLHLLMGLGRIQRAAGRKLLPIEAARQTIEELGGACFLTSLTTAVGFGSLMLSRTASIQRFGFCCAAGSLVLFVAVILLFFWMTSGSLGVAVANARPFRRSMPQRSRLLGRLVRLLRYPKTIVTVAVLACAVMAVVCADLKPNITWTESIAKASRTMRAIEAMDRHFGGTTYGAVLVRWSENQTVASEPVVSAMAATHRVINAEPDLGNPLSIANVLASMDYVGGGFERRWKNLQLRAGDRLQVTSLVNVENHEAIIYFLTADVGAKELEPTLQRVEQELQQISLETNVSLTLGGTPVVAGRVFTHMIGELAISLAVAAVLVFAIIAIPLRSLTLGLASILPNAFPLLVAGIAIHATTGHLTLTNTLTFCLCLGIAVDDTIHFLKAYQLSLQAGASVPRAVVVSLHRVGRVLLLSSLILAAGMAAMLTSEVPPLKIFAALAMLAITSALVGDLLILPAILLLTAKFRWSPRSMK